MEAFWNGVRILLRNSNRITGLVLATLGLGSAMGWWQLTPPQTDAIMVFLGALIVVISSFLTPTTDPVLAEGQSVRLSGSAGTGVVVKDG